MSMRRWIRPAAWLLGASVPLLVLFVHRPEFSTNGRAPAGIVDPAPAQRAAAAAEAGGRHDVSLDRVTTPAQLRAFLRSCEDASPDSLARLRHLAGSAQDPLVASHAVLALGRLGSGVDPLLLERLNDQRPAVRHAAIRGLGACADETAIPVLAGLLQDGDPTTRRLAIDALGSIGGERVARILGEYSARAEDETDRAFVRAALAGDAIGARAAVADGLRRRAVRR